MEAEVFRRWWRWLDELEAQARQLRQELPQAPVAGLVTEILRLRGWLSRQE